MLFSTQQGFIFRDDRGARLPSFQTGTKGHKLQFQNKDTDCPYEDNRRSSLVDHCKANRNDEKQKKGSCWLRKPKLSAEVSSGNKQPIKFAQPAKTTGDRLSAQIRHLNSSELPEVTPVTHMNALF